jgi:hypothetical protein
MATLALQCVEATYKHSIEEADDTAPVAEAASREIIASFGGIPVSYLEDALGGSKFVTMALEKNAPTTGKYLL